MAVIERGLVGGRAAGLRRIAAGTSSFGTWKAAGGQDPAGVWTQVIETWPGRPRPAAALRVVDQAHAATARRELIVWDLESGEPAQTLEGHAMASIAWPGRRTGGWPLDHRTARHRLGPWKKAGRPQTLEEHTNWVMAWPGRRTGGWPPDQMTAPSSLGTLEGGLPAQTRDGHESRAHERGLVGGGVAGRLRILDGTVIVWDPEGRDRPTR